MFDIFKAPVRPVYRQIDGQFELVYKENKVKY